MEAMKVGVIGCGNICKQYFKAARQFPILEMAACADLDLERARAVAATHEVPRACTVAELLADDEIEIVLNLTVPAAHVPVALEAVEHGKHVYSEKPLGVATPEGRKLLDAAAARGVRVGCAPDTFLGTANQACRKALDEGVIGRPVAATAMMMSRGPEPWHPSPHFYYQPGGGPMFDMGPYYLTALINMLGPIKRVTGMAGVLIADRVVGKGEHAGERIPVNTPDHVAGHIEFASGAIATLITSFAVKPNTHNAPQPISIFGTEGTIQMGDPNRFDHPGLVRRADEEAWREIAIEHDHPNGRSLGLAEMCHAIRSDRPHRASGELAFAVLAAVEGVLTSSERGEHVSVTGPDDRPAPLPVGLADGVLEPHAAGRE